MSDLNLEWIDRLLEKRDVLCAFAEAQITERCLKNHTHHHSACVSCEARRVLYGAHDDRAHSTPPTKPEERNEHRS